MSVKIDKRIPIPDRAAYHRGKWKDVLTTMKVGDSFAIEAATLESVRSSIQNLQKRLKQQWTIRKVGDAQYRCWRTK